MRLGQGGPGQQHQKLLAPVTPQQVIVAKIVLQRLGNMNQSLVTNGMAVTVIDLFEMVHIHEHHSQAFAIAHWQGKLLVEGL